MTVSVLYIACRSMCRSRCRCHAACDVHCTTGSLYVAVSRRARAAPRRWPGRPWGALGREAYKFASSRARFVQNTNYHANTTSGRYDRRTLWCGPRSTLQCSASGSASRPVLRSGRGRRQVLPILMIVRSYLLRRLRRQVRRLKEPVIRCRTFPLCRHP